MRGPCIVGGAPVEPRYQVAVKDTLTTEFWNATTSAGVNAVEGLHPCQEKTFGVLQVSWPTDLFRVVRC